MIVVNKENDALRFWNNIWREHLEEQKLLIIVDELFPEEFLESKIISVNYTSTLNVVLHTDSFTCLARRNTLYSTNKSYWFITFRKKLSVDDWSRLYSENESVFILFDAINWMSIMEEVRFFKE
jgi:hypothetical protein